MEFEKPRCARRQGCGALSPYSVQSKDISTLDPGDEDEMLAGWGGVAAYSARVSDTVAEAVRMSDA